MITQDIHSVDCIEATLHKIQRLVMAYVQLCCMLGF